MHIDVLQLMGTPRDDPVDNVSDDISQAAAELDHGVQDGWTDSVPGKQLELSICAISDAQLAFLHGKNAYSCEKQVGTMRP